MEQSGQYVEKFIPKACKYLKLGKTVPIHENGLPHRTWLHVQDTADAVLFLIESGVQNEIYNISGGYEQSNLETVKKIISLLEKNNKVNNGYIYIPESQLNELNKIIYVIINQSTISSIY